MPLLVEYTDDQPTASSSSPYSAAVEDLYNLRFQSTDSLDTLESDTARGLRGHGSVLDRIYTLVGDGLERWMNRLAVRSGRTPTAVKNQLEVLGEKCCYQKSADGSWLSVSRPYGDYSQLTPDEIRLMNKLCKLMLRFRNNRSSDTQLRAIQAIRDLILEYPALSAPFRTQGASQWLKTVLPHAQYCVNKTRGLLYARTRQALACIEEVEVVRLVCNMEIEGLDDCAREKIATRLASYAG